MQYDTTFTKFNPKEGQMRRKIKKEKIKLEKGEKGKLRRVLEVTSDRRCFNKELTQPKILEGKYPLAEGVWLPLNVVSFLTQNTLTESDIADLYENGVVRVMLFDTEPDKTVLFDLSDVLIYLHKTDLEIKESFKKDRIKYKLKRIERQEHEID